MAVNEQDYAGFALDPKTGQRHAINHLPKSATWEDGVYRLGDEEISVRILKYNKEKMKIPVSDCVKWFDYDKIQDSVFFRTPREGDYITLNPKGDKKRLNRLFIDRKVPARLRNELPVVAAGSLVLWIPGIRGSETLRVSDETENIMEMERKNGRDSS